MTDEPDIWTAEQVANLNRFQRFGAAHPFTCGTKEKHEQVEHPSGWTETVGEVLVATTKGWRCTVCDYKQNWADPHMLDFTEERAEAAREHFRKLLGPNVKFGDSADAG